MVPTIRRARPTGTVRPREAVRPRGIGGTSRVVLLPLLIASTAVPATAQRKAQRFAPAASASARVPPATFPAGDSAAASTAAERVVGGWLFGNVALVGTTALAAGLMPDDADGPALAAVLISSYAAGVTAGVVGAARGREGARPSRIFGAALVGALPVGLVLVGGNSPVGLAGAVAGWIGSPLAASIAQGEGARARRARGER